MLYFALLVVLIRCVLHSNLTRALQEAVSPCKAAGCSVGEANGLPCSQYQCNTLKLTPFCVMHLPSTVQVS